MVKGRLAYLVAGLVAASVLFLLWNLRAPYGFILSLRMTKLLTLILVGSAVGGATVLFQTVAANRLLTPGIVGFDALYILIQTSLVLALGGIGYAALPTIAQFGAETVILIAAAVTLFGVLLRRGAEDILKVVLTGVILGVLLRALTTLMQRLLEPSEFAIVQQASFASFGAVGRIELALAGAMILAALGASHRLAYLLDVAALGRQTAMPLGLDHDRVVILTLVIVAVLVAASTALVGPITFLGLLAASLAHRIISAGRHVILVPAAAVIGAGILVVGQFLFERLLGYQSTLAVIVEFFGGVLFLVLILKGSPR